MSLPKKPFFVLGLEYVEDFRGKSAQIHCISPKPSTPAGDRYGWEILKYDFDAERAADVVLQRLFPAFAFLSYQPTSVGRRDIPTKKIFDIELIGNTQNNWQQYMLDKLKYSPQNENYDDLVFVLGANTYTTKKGEKGAQISCIHPHALIQSDSFSGLLTQAYYADNEAVSKLIASKQLPVFAYLSSEERTFQGQAVDYLESFNPLPDGQKEFQLFTEKTFVLPKPTQPTLKNEQKQ